MRALSIHQPWAELIMLGRNLRVKDMGDRIPGTAGVRASLGIDRDGCERVNDRHGVDDKLGFAVQRTTVRFLGAFLAKPTDVPADIIAYIWLPSWTSAT
jgi:hypothetical protein